MGGADLFVILFGAPLLLLAISIPLILLQAVFRGGLRFSGWVIRRRNKPLWQKGLSRMMWGAFGLTLCAYAAWRSPGLVFDPSMRIALAGAGALALLLLCTGIHDSKGTPFEFMSAFCWAVLALGCAALLARNLSPADTAGELVKAFSAAALAATLVRFWRATGLGQGNARRMVNRQLRRNQTVLGRPPGWRPGSGVVAVGALGLLGLGAFCFFLW